MTKRFSSKPFFSFWFHDDDQ